MGRAVKPQTHFISPRRYEMDSISILSKLTQRDFDICVDIYEHRFLTTTQIYQLHFPSYSRARVRLHQLHQIGVLNRFRPPKRPGSWPWHYVLDKAGAEIVSDIRDVEADKLYFRRNRPPNLVKSPRLQHMRDTNEFFCRLIHISRQNGIELVDWLGERASMEACHGVVRPDGLGIFRFGETQTNFFLELDRGTESGSCLRDKIVDYEEVAISVHLPKLLLVCFSSTRRERSARPALRSTRLTVATSFLHWHLDRPLGPIWLPVNESHRRSLFELDSGLNRTNLRT